MSDESPRHDLTAEKNVLGAMMLREDVIPDVFRLIGEQGDHFYRPAHQMIYAAILAVYDRGQAPDATVVAAELTKRGETGRVGGAPYLHTLISEVPTATNAGYYARIIVDKSRDRAIEALAARLSQAAQEGRSADARGLVTEWLTTDGELASGESAPGWKASLADGAGFVLDASPTPRSIWGDGEQVGWADGEALLIAGPPGVGKTTTTVQLVSARLGITKELLGMPVQPGARNVLYLAMDRPPQIARAMGRVFGEQHRDVLSRLIVWKGPPPADLARNTGLLAEMCKQAEADTVIVDSLKDAVLKLSDDESGSGYNRARQQALVEGVQVVELHHQRKANGDNKKPSKLDDVYGSAWLTAGAGSVICLWGQAGDPVVELLHLKQPMEPIGPWQIMHDHTTGLSSVYHAADLLGLAQQWRPAGSAGLTAKAAACAMFGTEKPTPSEVEKARRKLDRYVGEGHMMCLPGTRGGGSATYYRSAAERAGEVA